MIVQLIEDVVQLDIENIYSLFLILPLLMILLLLMDLVQES